VGAHAQGTNTTTLTRNHRLLLHNRRLSVAKVQAGPHAPHARLPAAVEGRPRGCKRARLAVGTISSEACRLPRTRHIACDAVH
jgi:hypothetical protein